MSGGSSKASPALSVLDFGQFFGDQDADDLIGATMRYVVLAEELGFKRYWLAEHHETSMSWACPEMIVPLLASRTSRIRIGVAGILLHFYSAYRVAEIFALMERLNPGRTDCGLAAGISAEPVRGALLPGFNPEVEHRAGTYGVKVADVLRYLRGDFPKEHVLARGPAPRDTRVRSVWLMGLGVGNRILSSRNGTHFSYSLIHGGGKRDPAVIRAYRDEFQPSPELSAPSCNIACSVICAETPAEAAAQRRLYEAHTMGTMHVNACGTPDECREQLLELADRFDVDELVVTSLWHDLPKREASYLMLSDVFNLRRPASVAHSQPSAEALFGLSYHFRRPGA